MTPQTETQVGQVIAVAAPVVGGIVGALATPAIGAMVSGAITGAWKLVQLGLDPAAELERMVAYETDLAAARGKVASAEDEKFGKTADPAAVLAAAQGVSDRETADDASDDGKDDPYPDPSEDV